MLFINILNGIVPVIFLVCIGVYLSLKNLIQPKQYTVMLKLTFTIFFPIVQVYSLGQKNIKPKDFLLILSYYLSVLSLIPTFAVFSCLLFKNNKMKGFAHFFCITSLQNIIITGIFLTQGFYDKQDTEKYAYIIAFGQSICIIPLSFFFFEYAQLSEQNEKISLRGVSKLIGKSFLQTLKNPLVFSIFIALIYNVVKTLWFQQLANLPFYLSGFFQQLNLMVSNLGIVAMGVFCVNEINNQNQKDIITPNDQKTTGIRFWIILMVDYLLKHLIFPIIQTVIMWLLKIEKQSIKINSSLAACNSALTSFMLCDQHNVEGKIAAIIVFTGMFMTVISTPLLGSFVDFLCK